MNKPTKSEVVPGLILASTAVKTSGGEVLVLNVPTSGNTVCVEAFDWRGEPYTRNVPLSSLRWQ